MSFAHTEASGDRLTTPPVPPFAAQSASNITYNAPNNTYATMTPAPSPTTPKSVAFELVVDNMPQFKARLPMRVQIFPHDTTESIITTVKNFYGLYAGPGRTFGISFEDENGHTLIARYENFHDKMNVYIRVNETTVPTSGQYGPGGYQSGSPALGMPNYHNSEHQMLPPHQATSRPDSRASNARSNSPARGRRGGSATANQRTKKPISGGQSRGSSTHGSFADIMSDGANGYSSGDGAPGSVSSRSRGDLGNTEISIANIVEGGRRKRAKFESSELPLFAPPQMPAATSSSSVSPLRRMENQRAALPFTHPGQHAFAHPHVLQSPQNFGGGFAQSGPFVTPNNGARHSGPNFHRGSISHTPNSNNLLPTPDPTIGSCMSEEDKDVALQLMRLGAMSNQGSHARTSTSTMDDTFSGRAAASSTGATSDEESASEDDELPPARRQRLEYSPILPPGVIRRLTQPTEDLPASQDSAEMSEDFEDDRDATFNPGNGNSGAYAGFVGEKPRSRQGSVAKHRAKSGSTKLKSAKAPRSSNGVAKTKTSKNGGVGGKSQPMSPASMSNHSRKTSVASALNFQHQLGEDEEDLSSKPRCQRCRKSKKGCDRQRPCQRCKDAGLSAEQCVSEDEGNGRKGRYGRHMGVKVKKEDDVLAGQGQFYANDNGAGAPMGMEMLNTSGSPDKSKKRKR